MSGLGGNLGYPDNKQFRNSFGIIADPGTAGQEFRLISDLKVAAATRTLFFESTGDYIPGGSANGASIIRVDHAEAIARVVDIVLENRGPCDECKHELGFTIAAKAQHPGVMNDNRYGQRRTYSHKFEYLDAIVGGLISDVDLMRAYADITQQITDDSGRFNGDLQGNIEAVVTAFMILKFSATVAAATYDIPAAGLYGVSLAAASAYIDSPTVITGGATIGNTVVGDNTLTIANSVAKSMYVGQLVTPAVVAPTTQVAITKIVEGATNSVITLDTVWTSAVAATFSVSADAKIVVNDAVGITTPGYGFIVHHATATVSTHKMALTTKDIYKSLTTFNVEKLSGIFTITTTGAFELLPWAEVFREFSHMAHDVPLSNHHDLDKPSSAYPWTKFILETGHRNAGYHGASESGSYIERLVLFVPDNGATTGVAGCVDDLEDLFDTWAS